MGDVVIWDNSLVMGDVSKWLGAYFALNGYLPTKMDERSNLKTKSKVRD